MTRSRRADRYLSCRPSARFDARIDGVRDLRQRIARRVRNGWLRFSPDMPVFVICRDRVTPLRELLAWLEAEGLRNIILVDNDSTYPPLLALYAETTHRVLKLDHNVGATSPWLPEVIGAYARRGPFIVTDPDVLPVHGSRGAVKHFIRLLNRYPGYVKAGFGLKIDDLPSHYDLGAQVVKWETQMWVKEIEPDVFQAPIDTTLAVYRPGTPYVIGPALRTGGPFVARHEPWYLDSRNPGDEVTYYRARAAQGSATWGTSAQDAAHSMYDSPDGET
jgi:hypothetical protein